MLIKLFKIKNVKGRGKGLFAKKNIPKGTILFFSCKNCKYLTKEYFNKASAKERARILKYGCGESNGSFFIACDEAIYENHSCNSNMLDSRKGFDIAVNDIKKGEELTCDYRSYQDVKEQEFLCNCREKNCCKTVKNINNIPKKLKIFWNKKIKSALNQINKVNQPLKKELLKQMPELKKIFR